MIFIEFFVSSPVITQAVIYFREFKMAITFILSQCNLSGYLETFLKIFKGQLEIPDFPVNTAKAKIAVSYPVFIIFFQ
jgi:hypothetical protein